MTTAKETENEHTQPRRTTSPIAVALAWILVAIPLGYGLQSTFAKALQLFVG